MKYLILYKYKYLYLSSIVATFLKNNVYLKSIQEETKRGYKVNAFSLLLYSIFNERIKYLFYCALALDTAIWI